MNILKDIFQGWSDSWWKISKLRTTKQTLQRRLGRESIVGIFPSRREDTEMESRWCDEDRYIQLVGRQGSSTIFRLPRDPRRPEEPQCSLHLSSSGPFTLSLNQTRGGRVVRFPGFGKNSWDISLIFYIQHYPCWAICPWFRVNPLLWFNTSGQPFLIRIMQFRSKSC